MRAIRQPLIFVAVLLLVALAWPHVSRGQDPEEAVSAEEILETKVGHIAEERDVEVMGQQQLYQKLELIVTSGPRRGDIIVVENGTLPQANVYRYREGERVFVRASAGAGTTEYDLDIPSRWVALAGVAVGQDHIASMVNTLALVYAGAALPLLLLLRTSPLPLSYMLSQEVIAEEIVRMSVASIGLMAAVPMTTLLAATAERYRRRGPAADE